ncbi:MAG: hypothetical protein A3F12_01925 [Gammaproteobacteria bacterium RIFCSPHIGHO2_12_FULL_38_14]|nr:MAG: hypothetical protein A3F12_01925 [Gammaproteobacteria bacterium RIFCSPHIGHO2_12_FULL_38_14]
MKNELKLLKFSLPLLFFFSIFFHLFGFLFVYFFNIKIKIPVKLETPYYYVPDSAYVMPSYVASSGVAHTNKNQSAQEINKTKLSLESEIQRELSSFSSDYDFMKEITKRVQYQKPSPEKYTEAIHMIGDKFLDDPLRKLLGHAITRRLYYPKVASDLHMRGVVSIGFTLLPTGEVVGARIVKSSRERILDIAALNAINDASPINNVDIYVKKPKYLIVNIIY